MSAAGQSRIAVIVVLSAALLHAQDSPQPSDAVAQPGFERRIGELEREVRDLRDGDSGLWHEGRGGVAADGSRVFATLIAPSVSLAGLLLVFVGFLITSAAGEDRVPERRKIQRVARWGLAPVALSLMCAALCTLALADALDPRVVVVSLFLVNLMIVLAYAVWAARYI